jgi:hypothetical protein
MAGENAGDAASGDPADVQNRAAHASRRREELARRGRELSERLLRLRAGEPSRSEDATLAAEAEQAERGFAAVAEARAADAMRRSAEAHDRAADAHDRAADAHAGDEADHRARAARHRLEAAQDRSGEDVEEAEGVTPGGDG